MKIIQVDCNYVEPEFASSYLLIQDGRGFFVECNTNYAIPYLKKAAQDAGLSADQIDGLLITHVHLDHAGGAGLFLKEFPKARLYAHPRAATHAIDPTRLVEGATLVYGPEFMKKMYGEVLPCPAERVTILGDGQSVVWQTGKQELHLPTRHLLGHAKHHLCMIESETKTLFSGDSFGVSYPKINHKCGWMIIPSTSPTNFDGLEAIKSVQWIRDAGMNSIALTHYEPVPKEKISISAEMLIDQLNYSMELCQEAKEKGLSEAQMFEKLETFTVNYFSKRGVRLDQDDLKHLNIDLKVNAQGLHYAANHA